jgi:hypothetical protein
MASPMPAAQSSNPPAAGEVDEYGLQTKFMNCMKFSVLPLSELKCRVLVGCSD